MVGLLPTSGASDALRCEDILPPFTPPPPPDLNWLVISIIILVCFPTTLVLKWRTSRGTERNKLQGVRAGVYNYYWGLEHRRHT
ncbi:hypothetical protein Pcinc_036274 [Petrolisthes cinctipes]|uniref:Uncharacterized protein n=1 Tax=Petrolisthes cinctipes TaxID=88211 RepID=A0AAE1BWG5_PETCI|nr:hypothetical protein Pcinc_036274 [Petrolisthes cinctipes]